MVLNLVVPPIEIGTHLSLIPEVQHGQRILLRPLAVHEVRRTNSSVRRWYEVLPIYQRRPPMPQLSVRWEAMQRKHIASAMHFRHAVLCTWAVGDFSSLPLVVPTPHDRTVLARRSLRLERHRM